MRSKDVSGFEFDVKKSRPRIGNFAALEEDEWYPAGLAEVKRDEAPFGPVLHWWFELRGKGHSYEYEGKRFQKRVRGATSLTCTPKSKMYAWYVKIMGEEPEIGEKVALKDLFGVPCDVMVKNSRGKEDEDGNAQVWSHVVKVRKGRIKVADDEEDDGEEEEEAPKRKAKKSRKPKKETVEETEDEDGDLFDDIF